MTLNPFPHLKAERRFVIHRRMQLLRYQLPLSLIELREPRITLRAQPNPRQVQPIGIRQALGVQLRTATRVWLSTRSRSTEPVPLRVPTNNCGTRI